MTNWLDRLTKRRVGAFDPTVKVLRTAAADAQRSRLPQMAAALSYRTIFGLLPVVVVALLVVRYMAAPDTQKQLIRDAMEYVGLSSIAIPQGEGRRAPAPSPEPGADGVGPPMPEGLLLALESAPNQNLDAWVEALVQRAESNVKFGAISSIGLVTLIYAAIAMVVEIERAFNQIFRVPRGRSWARRVINYWALLTLGTIGLATTFYVGAMFKTWAASLVGSTKAGSWLAEVGPFTLSLIGYGVTVTISTAALTIIYGTVPNTRVRAMPALAGAFLAALLWEAGKWGFGEYLTVASASNTRLYGSLALLPLFLLWVYVTWTIVLFGLQVTYQLQYGLKKTIAQPITELGPALVEPASALLVLSAVARAFQKGKPLTIAQIATEAGVQEGVAALVVGAVSERGLVHRLDRPDTPDHEPVYTLALPPGAIPADGILTIGFELAGVSGAHGDGADRGVIERLRRAQLDAAKGQTLASVAGLAAALPGGEGREAQVEASPSGVRPRTT